MARARWDATGGLAQLELNFDPDRLELTMETSMPLSRLPIFNGIDADLMGKASGAGRTAGALR